MRRESTLIILRNNRLHSVPLSNEWICADCLMCIKMYFKHMGTNSTYKGGLSSSAIAVMLASSTRVLKTRNVSPSTLETVCFFFALYGLARNLKTCYISHRDITQDCVPTCFVQDPTLEDNNLASGMFDLENVHCTIQAACICLRMDDGLSISISNETRQCASEFWQQLGF